MGRLFKSGVDYFPLDVNIDDKVRFVQAKHGLTGFAVWVKLLQKIYSESFWLQWEEENAILLADEINVDINEVNDIINSMLCWNVFCKCMYENYCILTSQGLQKRYFKITERRKKIEIVKEFMLIDVKPQPKQEFVYVDINSINTNISTQSKVKESKVKYKKNTAFDNAGSDEEFYLTKKGRKLSEKRLESFNRFWIDFNYKKGKAEAADAWLNIPQLTNSLVDEICKAAGEEAKIRPRLLSQGKTPKMAQGWLTGRRWEDENSMATENETDSAPSDFAKEMIGKYA